MMFMLEEKINTILMSMFPIGELRTSIPIAIHLLNLHWIDAFLYSDITSGPVSSSAAI